MSRDELAFRPKPYSNSIAFLLWHLARVEDIWINRNLLGEKQIYETDGWSKKFGTSAQDSGFGYDIKALDTWPVPDLELLLAFAAAVRVKTQTYLNALEEKSLDEMKDFGRGRGTISSAVSHLVTEVWRAYRPDRIYQRLYERHRAATAAAK